MRRRAECLAKCEALSSTGCELVTGSRMTSVFSITIQRRALSTSLPEKSSTIVIKMLHHVLEHPMKAFKSGAETYAKVIRLCDETRHEAVAVTEPTTTDTVHSSVVRATDCRSASPWFNSGRRSWFTFMTWSSNQIIQMINIMSPITTSIRTITRKSVNMVAELDNDTAPSRIPDTTDCLERRTNHSLPKHTRLRR